jgi:acetyl esterase
MDRASVARLRSPSTGDNVFDTYKEAAARQAASGAAPGDPLTQTIDEARARQDRYFASLTGVPPAVAATRDERVPGPQGDTPVRIAYPATGRPLGCIVFVRGAGFWAGGLDSHTRTVNTLANLSGCAVCAVDYRRTPEFAYPTQRDEVLAVLGWLRANRTGLGLAATEPVLFGESAGATICLTAALAMRDTSGPMPAGLVLFYNNGAGAKPTSRPYSQWVWSQYVGGNDPDAVPGPAPLKQELHGLPPAWIACGEDDPLMPDTLLLDEKLAAAGVPHTLRRYPGMPHAFVMFTATLKPALDALTEAAQAAAGFVRGGTR